jgi:hypothetical protein
MTVKKFIATGAALVAVLSMATPAAAQDADEVLKALDAALPGSLIHNPLDLSWEAGGDDLKTKVVDAAALTSGQAVSAKVKKRQDKPWDSHVKVEIEGEVKKGDKVQVFYWARTQKSAAGKDTAHISLFLGRNEEPYDYIIAEEIFPEEEWKLASVTGIAKTDFKAGKLKAEYQLGRSKQTVEFGPIYVSTLGPATD